MAKDYYETLGVSKSASEQELKAAYRKQALQWHPDRNKTKQAEDKFKEINQAYEVLSDPQKKAAYDQYGHAAFEQGGFGNAGGGGGQGPFGGGTYRQGPFTYSYTSSGGNPFQGADFGGFSDPFDIFEQFFGGGSGFARQQRRSAYSITIDFMEAVKGVEKELIIEGKPKAVKIPAGIDNGQHIRFSDFDLVIKVRSHKEFKRQGDDIIVDLPVTFAQAALGDTVTVPTIEHEVSFKIKPGTQPGTLIRLQGRGVANIRTHRRGDQYVKISIAIPSKLTNRQKQLFEELRREGV